MQKTLTNKQLTREQLQRVVRTIVMHDVTPQMTTQFKHKPVEVSRYVLDALSINFSPAEYNRKDAEQVVFDELMGCQ